MFVCVYVQLSLVTRVRVYCVCVCVLPWGMLVILSCCNLVVWVGEMVQRRGWLRYVSQCVVMRSPQDLEPHMELPEKEDNTQKQSSCTLQLLLQNCCETILISCCQCIFMFIWIAWISWYKNLSKYFPALRSSAMAWLLFLLTSDSVVRRTLHSVWHLGSRSSFNPIRSCEWPGILGTHQGVDSTLAQRARTGAFEQVAVAYLHQRLNWLESILSCGLVCLQPPVCISAKVGPVHMIDAIHPFHRDFLRAPDGWNTESMPQFFAVPHAVQSIIIICTSRVITNFWELELRKKWRFKWWTDQDWALCSYQIL